MRRLREHFTYDEPSTYTSASNTPSELYPQERDWTCSVACIRTILSGVTKNIPSENEFLEKYNIEIGGHYVDEFIEKNMLFPAEEIRTHHDYKLDEIGLPLLNKLLGEKYFIMVECMYNYAHWVVVLGYYAVRERQDTEEHKILIYDPYYNEVRMVIADELLTMWCDPEGHEKEFVAIR